MDGKIKVTSQELRKTGELLLQEYADARREYYEVLEQIEALSAELRAMGVELLKKRLTVERGEAETDFELLRNQLLKLAEIADIYEEAERGNVDAVQTY